MASVSGAILVVCSCTVLPLFAGICKRGAVLGHGLLYALGRAVAYIVVEVKED